MTNFQTNNFITEILNQDEYETIDDNYYCHNMAEVIELLKKQYNTPDLFDCINKITKNSGNNIREKLKARERGGSRFFVPLSKFYGMKIVFSYEDINQNRNEAKIGKSSRYSDIVPRVIDAHPNYLFIIVERCRIDTGLLNTFLYQWFSSLIGPEGANLFFELINHIENNITFSSRSNSNINHLINGDKYFDNSDISLNKLLKHKKKIMTTIRGSSKFKELMKYEKLIKLFQLYDDTFADIHYKNVGYSNIDGRPVILDLGTANYE